jgi:hypothetical protein
MALASEQQAFYASPAVSSHDDLINIVYINNSEDSFGMNATQDFGFSKPRDFADLLGVFI